MGDVLAVDFRSTPERYLGKVPTVEEGLKIIEQAMPKSIDDIPWPGMDIPYAAPESDPA